MGSSLPIKIVVQNLDRRGPRPPSNFLCDCNEDSRIWFPDEKALFSLPFKRMSVSEEVSYTGVIPVENGAEGSLTYSSQLKHHLWISVPVDLNSTT